MAISHQAVNEAVIWKTEGDLVTIRAPKTPGGVGVASKAPSRSPKESN